MGMIRSKKLNKIPGVSTGKTQNCGKQSDRWANSAPVKGQAPKKK